VKLGLVENPPAAWRAVRRTRLAREGSQVLADARPGEGVRRRRTRAHDELAVDELGHHVVGDLHEIVVRDPALGTLIGLGR
jgi:hypothetical protein